MVIVPVIWLFSWFDPACPQGFTNLPQISDFICSLSRSRFCFDSWHILRNLGMPFFWWLLILDHCF
jgi:hypothetical protein